jgi:hypothetical protein
MVNRSSVVTTAGGLTLPDIEIDHPKPMKSPYSSAIRRGGFIRKPNQREPSPNKNPPLRIYGRSHSSNEPESSSTKKIVFADHLQI